LVVVTPNIGSLAHRLLGRAWQALDPPRHIMLFSPKTLRICAESAGLRVAEIWTSTSSAPVIWARSRVIQRQGRVPDFDPWS
jgi:hydroxyacyl-ACP dehydratase HTD2-like protein with hotdog domain